MTGNSRTESLIDTVIFDVGQVLYRWDLRYLYEKLIDDPEELDWFLAHVVTPDWHFQHDAGRPLAEMVPERISEFPRYEKHIRAYAERFIESIPGPIDATHDLARRLANSGVTLYGLTNFAADFWQMFRPTAPIFNHFRDVLVSGEEKLAKPDPAIYHLALERFEVAPEQCLFVDDRPENIAAGQALGIRGHCFGDAKDLERELESLQLI
ncbi:2-haloacid dehalogenase [Parasphingorhabdus marina DSM 22363]|uniref:2-haloacid dehalogenase n=1 Tax=Parasphingorhabdus marina DSM 22363 TaxID=1123272 RepID=A0A1N6CQK7_9SPHN|nr:HAD family phosphatase [Parasphingorhabdus marina]SIN60848.1 2-haloacid dehalogenase [Parasphingorhabdus marina DSM 22363]